MLYAYPLSEIESLHSLSDAVDFNGAKARFCVDCGYTLIHQPCDKAQHELSARSQHRLALEYETSMNIAGQSVDDGEKRLRVKDTVKP